MSFEVRGEAFNVLNHVNFANPNSALNLNFATGADTNGAFGTITGVQVDARHVILSGRLRFQFFVGRPGVSPIVAAGRDAKKI